MAHQIEGFNFFCARVQRGAPVLSDFVTYDEGEGLQHKPNLASVQQLLFQIAAPVNHPIRAAIPAASTIRSMRRSPRG
jgi:hypothetical protein